VTARYRAERRHTPILPARFEQPDAILPNLESLASSVPGVSAIRDGEPVGFLLAYVGSHREARNAYCPDCAHGAEIEGLYDIYRAMYAHLVPRWLAHGCFGQAITFYAHEREAIDAWVSLGFGLIVIDALRDLDLIPSRTADVEIRRCVVEDVDLVAPLDLALRRHLAAPPTFLPMLIEDGRRSLEAWLADPTHALWAAQHEGSAVGYLRMEPSESPNLPVTSDTTVAITGAYTAPHARGRGVGTALLNHGLDWARSAGYAHCSVDFESANIPGSRFWLGSGFQPVCSSLSRRVDERLAWAHGGRDEEEMHWAYARG
jgi:GNAT superfamily N-acetyltransferase